MGNFCSTCFDKKKDAKAEYKPIIEAANKTDSADEPVSQAEPIKAPSSTPSDLPKRKSMSPPVSAPVEIPVRFL